jgi:DNA-binding MarR family transcriptional regulator
MYDEALRPHGLRTTQFMDSTTLTRTLRLMRRSGWIAERRGEDRRERLLRIAAEGRRRFDRALPAWERTQTHLKQRLGDGRWNDLKKQANELSTLVMNGGEKS